MQFDNSAPIWLQLVDECSRRIVTGEWQPRSKMPGVRELGLEFGVNPNTMQRALAELDRRGITVPDRTIGRFVTGDVELIRALRGEVASKSADEYARKAKGLGLELDDATRLLARSWNEQEGDAQA